MDENEHENENENENETVFQKIISREIPADILYEDDRAIAIRDINPVAPIHYLVIPKQTLPSLREATADDESLLGHMLVIAARIAREQGISEDGYRVVINSGSHGGQEVFQLHMHVLGGRGMAWPPG
jgi:histidine triad (HIT) family protein